MKRKTDFNYFTISKGYAEGELHVTAAFLSEKGLELLDQLLTEQASKKPNTEQVKQ